MQFNLVVSTNEDAIRLWLHHPQRGYVDAFVICKQLAT